MRGFRGIRARANGAEDEDRKNFVDSVGSLAFETDTAIGAQALIEPSDAGRNGCAVWRNGSPTVLFRWHRPGANDGFFHWRLLKQYAVETREKGRPICQGVLNRPLTS